jgi:hypothetical protein
VNDQVKTLEVGRNAILEAMSSLEEIIGGSGAMYVMGKLPNSTDDKVSKFFSSTKTYLPQRAFIFLTLHSISHLIFNSNLPARWWNTLVLQSFQEAFVAIRDGFEFVTQTYHLNFV